MTRVKLPHVVDSFDSLDGALRVLTVVTDLPTTPGAPGFNGEALHKLHTALGKLIDPRRGYDKVHVITKDNI